MSSSYKRQHPKKSGIKGNHEQKKSSVMIYAVIFIVVSIVMITLNQTRKKNLSNEQTTNYSPKGDTDNQFTKEGELVILHAQDTITKIDIAQIPLFYL